MGVENIHTHNLVVYNNNNKYMADSSFKMAKCCKIDIIDSYTGINQKTLNCNFCQNKKCLDL